MSQIPLFEVPRQTAQGEQPAPDHAFYYRVHVLPWAKHSDMLLNQWRQDHGGMMPKGEPDGLLAVAVATRQRVADQWPPYWVKQGWKGRVHWTREECHRQAKRLGGTLCHAAIGDLAWRREDVLTPRMIGTIACGGRLLLGISPGPRMAAWSSSRPSGIGGQVLRPPQSYVKWRGGRGWLHVLEAIPDAPHRVQVVKKDVALVSRQDTRQLGRIFDLPVLAVSPDERVPWNMLVMSDAGGFE